MGYVELQSGQFSMLANDPSKNAGGDKVDRGVSSRNGLFKLRRSEARSLGLSGAIVPWSRRFLSPNLHRATSV
jgi:hypothetical protein